MKYIELHLKESKNPIIATDNDDTDITLYEQNLSVLFSNDTITSVQFTSGSILIRPSELNAIVVKEVDKTQLINKNVSSEIREQNNKEESEDIVIDDDEDIITDGD